MTSFLKELAVFVLLKWKQNYNFHWKFRLKKLVKLTYKLRAKVNLIFYQPLTPIVAKTPAAATAATAAQTPPPPPSPKTPLKPDETFSSSIPDVAPPMTPADNDYRYTLFKN